jgi:hypothetical protein
MLGADTCTWAGPSIVIHCAACDELAAQAETYEYGERVTLLHVVPITPYIRTNYVRCTHCGEQFISPIPLSELPYLQPDELHQLLRRRVSLIPQFLAVVGIILCWVPIIGLIMALLALFTNWSRKKHWTRIVSRVAVVIALITSGFMGLMMLLAALGVVQ